MKILKFFITLALKHVFWKTKKVLEKLKYHFLFESTMMENAVYSCKTALSKANVKTNKIWSTK